MMETARAVRTATVKRVRAARTSTARTRRRRRRLKRVQPLNDDLSDLPFPSPPRETADEFSVSRFSDGRNEELEDWKPRAVRTRTMTLYLSVSLSVSLCMRGQVEERPNCMAKET